MKRVSLIVACSLLALTGCTCSQGASCLRPSNLLNHLHDKIYGTNVGQSCMAGGCGSAPAMPPPMSHDPGCANCEGSVQSGYESYPSVYDAEPTGSYAAPIQGTIVPSGETIAPMRAQ